MEALASCSCPQ